MSFLQLIAAVFCGTMATQLCVHAHNIMVLRQAKRAQLARLKTAFASFELDDPEWLTPTEPKIPSFAPPPHSRRWN